MSNKNVTSTTRTIVRFVLVFLKIICLIPIQIVFIPFAIIGFLHALYTEMVLSKKNKISFSAVQSLQYRWIMHYFQTREDSLSIKFIKKFPCESHFGLCSTFGALIISQRLFGLKTGLAKMSKIGRETLTTTPGRRLLMFDEIINKHIDNVDQIVIPGSGFDLMALRYTKNKKVKVFEIDQTKTINMKTETLRNANIEHNWVTYIPVDYKTESWVEKLIAAGFDKTKNTLFIWQSVSLYLDDETVKKMLKQINDLCTSDSIIAQDFYSKAFVEGKTSQTVKKSSALIAKMGEPWKFGIDMSTNAKTDVESFLNSNGFKMTEYFQFGIELDVIPFYCIVEAKKNR